MRNAFNIKRCLMLSGLISVFLSGCMSSLDENTTAIKANAISCPPDDNQINCQVPSAPTACLTSFPKKLLEFGQGDSFLIEPGQRKQGTRSPVHTHPNNGATCVLQGEMTLMLEGEPNRTFTGNLLSLKQGEPGTVQCYPMPKPSDNHANKMSAENTGNEPALIIDIFPVPEGEDWQTFNPMCVLQSEGLPVAPDCYKTGVACPPELMKKLNEIR